MKLTSATTTALAFALTIAFVGCGEDKPTPPPSTGTGGTSKTGGSGGGGKGGTGGGGGGSGGTAGVDAAVGSETGGDVASETGADAAPTIAEMVTCTGVKDKTKAIVPAAGRKVYCAVNLGSNNLKLQVISMEAGQPLSFKDERACRVKTEFGKKVYDSTAMVAKPLPAASIADLAAAITEFKRICTLDQGELVGAEATQWGRWATNIAEIKTMVMTATGTTIEVLTPEQEGQYGYVAATRNAPEKISLDPGSNSFQIGWFPKGATAPRTVSVPFGYVLGATEFYPEASTDTYAVAAGKHAAKLKTLFDEELKKLTPPSSLVDLKAAVTAGNLKPEIFIVGQDGALHLSVKAQLRDATTGTWIDTDAAYQARVGMEMPMADPMFGTITTKLTPPDVTKFLTTEVKDADFAALRSAKVRAIYGEKALANAVLLNLLVTELGLTTIVLVPQEMPAGYILAKNQVGGGPAGAWDCPSAPVLSPSPASAIIKVVSRSSSHSRCARSSEKLWSSKARSSGVHSYSSTAS